MRAPTKGSEFAKDMYTWILTHKSLRNSIQSRMNRYPSKRTPGSINTPDEIVVVMILNWHVLHEADITAIFPAF